MDWTDLLSACALYLVLEGLLPFVSPASWRRGLSLIEQLTDGQLRSFGLVSIGAGLLILLVVRGG